MIEDEGIAHITGNASEEIKRLLAKPSEFFTTNFPSETTYGPNFGQSITERLVVTEISVNGKVEEPMKLEGKVVCEIIVQNDMVNGAGNVHGGCSAFLIDVCSGIALIALSMATTGDAYPSVSQSLNIVYHSPAALGDRIRLVNTTMSLGARAHSARTEIWNVTHHRLVASGVHIKMQPSYPKANL